MNFDLARRHMSTVTSLSRGRHGLVSALGQKGYLIPAVLLLRPPPRRLRAHAMKHSLQHCIDSCTNCHQVCTATLKELLADADGSPDPLQVAILIDCAEICSLSADYMLRGSELHRSVCEVCAEVCVACAEECERADGAPSKLLDCAAVCRSCAESCNEMATGAAS
jgi:hypothetical protein